MVDNTSAYRFGICTQPHALADIVPIGETETPSGKQIRMMKDKDGNVMTDEESVLRIWKEYYMGLMNEENERER